MLRRNLICFILILASTCICYSTPVPADDSDVDPILACIVRAKQVRDSCLDKAKTDEERSVCDERYEAEYNKCND